MRGFVATLSNGEVVQEDSVMHNLYSFIGEYNLQNKAPWVILKEYIKKNNLKIIGLNLQFDHQGVFIPSHSKVYFYSKKVEAYLGGSNDQVLYYGVGASDRSPTEVEITWYDGNNSKIERREVDAESPAFVVNR